tara:strand:+ start:9648 stop:10763 length:1116 start_codon:yes stop_codon:yes gene_type:complete
MSGSIPTENSFASGSITWKPFGKVDDQDVKLYTLTNSNGVSVSITNYGGIVTSILVPDQNGILGDVVLGYHSVEEYVAGSPYFGCITGRYANRIANGKFSIDGKEYQLAINNPPNHLHGGEKGFDKQIWEARAVAGKERSSVILTHTSPDGDEGYPGNLKMRVIYTLTHQNALRIQYYAESDKKTVVNLTNHTYFNLAGEGSGDILKHRMRIVAGRYTPVDENLIPTGIALLDGTPLDFRKATPIGKRIGEDHDHLKFGLGYDHNYVVGDARQETPSLVAVVTEPNSGRMLKVFTTEPGLQFYSGNFLDGSNVGKSGKAYEYRNGFCLEAQIFPDSPNHENKGEGYTTAILKPGKTYTQTTVYRFDVVKPK